MQPIHPRTGKVRTPLFDRSGVQRSFGIAFWLVLLLVLAVVFLYTASGIPSSKKKNALTGKIRTLSQELESVKAEYAEITDIAYVGSKAADLGLELPNESTVITLDALSPRP